MAKNKNGYRLGMVKNRQQKFNGKTWDIYDNDGNYLRSQIKKAKGKVR